MPLHMDNEYLNTPEYREFERRLNEYHKKCQVFDDTSIQKFTSQMCSSIIADNSSAHKSNLCFSPMSFYISLIMIAYAANGKARQEILDALGANDLDELIDTYRFFIDSIDPWNAPGEKYFFNSARFVVANGIWANQEKGISLKENFITKAEQELDTECDTCESADTISKKIHSWAKEKSNGFLSTNMSLDDDDALVLASLLYFKGAWSDEFYEQNTYDETFHTTAGDVVASFMHDTDNGTVYRGEKFVSASRHLGSREMMFFLSDEGEDIHEIMSKFGDVKETIRTIPTKKFEIEWHIPKFDISSTDANLVMCAEEMGISKVFIPSDAFYGTIEGNDADKAFVSKIEQETRIAIDEKGCEAASLTVDFIACLGGSFEKYDKFVFNLNRPFAFAIFDNIWQSTNDGTDKEQKQRIPLFIGIINDPTRR